MLKKFIAIIMSVLMVCSFASCGSKTAETSSETPAQETTTEGTTMNSKTESNANAIGTVSNTLASDEDALVNDYSDKFKQVVYADSETGLSVTYNLFLPDNYDKSKKYPTVVFIADSSCVGSTTSSLTQGLGALVWATDEWQKANETIVVVPTYNTTVLDDHSGYTKTEYVELTKRLIDDVSEKYAVDTNRIYGTGQSMGCMIHLILAAEYSDLYAACMFVDGQWDTSELKGLKGQSFVYFAAEDDDRANSGMSEVISMFDADATSYSYEQWDGNWTPDELSSAAEKLFNAGTDANFISWKTGTIATSGGMQGSAHMASFDYAYNCIAVMEWLFAQTK